MEREVLIIDIDSDRAALPGDLPIDDITADGGGQLTEVGSPYDGTGGVVRGTERWIEWDHFGSVHAALRRMSGRRHERPSSAT